MNIMNKWKKINNKNNCNNKNHCGKKTNKRKLTQLLLPSTKMLAEVLPTPVRMGGARIPSRKVLFSAARSNTWIKLSECVAARFCKYWIYASDSPVSTNWRTPSSTRLPTEKRERDWPWEYPGDQNWSYILQQSFSVNMVLVMLMSSSLES